MTSQRREILAEMGLTPQWIRRAWPVASQVVAAVAAPVEAAVGAPVGRPPVGSPPASPARELAEPAVPDDVRAARIAALSWKEFAADVEACTACGLCRTRNRSVPGVGDVEAEWMFVGEAPGAEEDGRGEPFVGQAGRLLDNMLAALQMTRQRNVYIANVLKCRPPGNRTPEAAEAAACQPYLARQIALLRPRVIVALGKSAASLLLRSDATIGSLRGRVHDYGGVPLIVTY
ncbi:MAG: uracil-DNA glycosylase, partial [Casimicrobiaceae bacterium]